MSKTSSSAKSTPPQSVPAKSSKRRTYPEEFRQEAVQMLLDGHSAASVVERLGLTSPNLLYQWKKKLVVQGGPVAASLESRVQQLEADLMRAERERDILKKALAIFGRHV